jgi:hypothetical protein
VVSEIIERIRESALRRLLFLPHAIRQMSRPDRIVTPAEVEAVVATGELVEDYPEDVRGHSCPLLGFGDGGRPVHVVCSPREDYLAVITAYLPNPSQWSSDFRRRLK